MSKVKNISGGPLDVPLLDRQVEGGEVVDVPDFQPDGVSAIIWPGDKWEPVAKDSEPITAAPLPEAAPPDQAAPPVPDPVSSDPRERR